MLLPADTLEEIFKKRVFEIIFKIVVNNAKMILHFSGKYVLCVQRYPEAHVYTVPGLHSVISFPNRNLQNHSQQ